MTGIGIGMALGAFVSGWVVDSFGPRSGFWVSVAAASLALLTIALGQRELDEARPAA
jgi:predicted MFS family arabinose efflux permease